MNHSESTPSTPQHGWDEAPAFLARLSADGQILAHNSYWQERLGWQAGALDGLPFEALLSESQRPALRAVLDAPTPTLSHLEATAHGPALRGALARWTLRPDAQGQWWCSGVEVAEVAAGWADSGLSLEEWGRLITRSRDAVFSVLYPDGSIRYESPSVEAVLGYRPEELAGRPIFDLVHEDDLGRLAQIIAQAAAGTYREGAPVRYRLRHKDGRWLLCETSGVSVLRDGEVRALALISRSVQATHEASTRHAAEVQRLRDALSSRPSRPLDEVHASQQRLGVFTFVREGRTERLIDINATGWQWLDALAEPPHDGEPWHLGLFDHEIRMVCLQAARRERIASSLIPAPHTIEVGGTLEVVAISTPPNMLTLAIYRRPPEARDTVSYELTALVHDAALVPMSWETLGHDLRAPLHAILGFSRVLREEHREGTLTPEALDADLGRIQAGTARLMTLLGDLLWLMRLESGAVNVSMEDVSARELAAALRHEDQLLTESRALRVVIDEVDGLYTDRDKLIRALAHLLQHVRSFTTSPALTLRVVRAMTRSLPGVEFSLAVDPFDAPQAVRDLLTGRTAHAAGPGDSPSHHAALLGFEVVRRLIHVLGGRFEARLGAHTAHLNIYLPSPTELPQIEELTARQTPTHITGPQAALRQRHLGGLILLIDDEPETHELISRYLKRTTWEVVSAWDGQQGLRRARRFKPDVILLDIIMPHHDGWTVLSELRQDPELRQTPILIHSVIDDRELMLSLGASGYLPKPMTREALLDRLVRLRAEADVTPPPL